MKLSLKNLLLFLPLMMQLPNPAHAGLYEESRIASSSLYCSSASRILGNNEDAELFEILGKYIIRGIYERYSQGIISKAEIRENATAFMYIIIEPYNDLPEQDIDFVTDIVADSFLNPGSYEKASEGKTGIEAFIAQRDRAKDTYGRWECARILSEIK